MELVLSMAMITIIFAVVLPQFAILRKSWDLKQGTSEAIQNGRVLIDHINRNLSKAVRITAVSESSVTNGYIQFISDVNDSNTYRYDIGANNYVEYGPIGTLSDLAGPVSSLRFTCYDACDLDNPLLPVTDTNDVRVVKVDATFTNSASIGQNKTFTTWVYLRTNANFGNWCAYNDCVYDRGLVGYGTDPYGNIVHYGDTNRITVYGIGTISADHQTPPGVGYSASSGQLKNYATGAGTGVTATLTQSGGVVWQPIVGCVSGTCWSGGYDTAVCTDAYNTFHGIVDMTGIVYYGSAGWWVDVTFTGLDPSKMYTFATSASRAKSTTDGAPGYPTRLSVYTISGVDAATNASTPGTTEVSNPYSVRFNTGNNHFEGYVARWTGIRPGTDGSFKVRAQADPNSESGYKAYAFSVFELQSAETIAQLTYPISYRDFTEVKAGTDTTSVAISTPATNTGDLLIAAVATDGDTSASLAAPGDWTLINCGACSGAVTLGAWRKFSAGASEPNTHTFTWTGGEQAYGWMMRFTGHDPTDPISDYSAGNESSSNPTSPAVTTTVGCSLILRLGAFDDDDVNTLPEPGNPGLSGHVAITMDESASSSGGTVAILGSWVTGTSHTMESGTNRALVFVAHAENSSIVTLNSVTYGGQAMTKVIDINVGSTTLDFVVAYTLNEAGVAAATSGTFVPTWSTTPSSVAYASVFLQNVNQTTPVGATARNSTEISTPNPITTTALTTSGWDMAIVAATCGNSGSYTLNNGFTEGIDQTMNSTATGVTGHKSATGASETPSAGHSGPNRQVIIGFVVQGSGFTGTCSGGAGYVRQSSAGSSGTSTFTLGSSNEARMLTIAIAPADAGVHDCCGDLRP